MYDIDRYILSSGRTNLGASWESLKFEPGSDFWHLGLPPPWQNHGSALGQVCTSLLTDKFCRLFGKADHDISLILTCAFVVSAELRYQQISPCVIHGYNIVKHQTTSVSLLTSYCYMYMYLKSHAERTWWQVVKYLVYLFCTCEGAQKPHSEVM